MSASAAAANKGERTREAILETAVELASAEGLEGLTIGRLAAELRMSKSGLFAHFGSKQELQLATVAAAGERFRAEVIEPARALPPGAERLRAIGNGYLDRVNDYVGGCFWFAVTAEYDDRPGPVRDAIAAAMDAWLGLIAAEARAAGHPDPDRFAFEFYAAGLGANARFRLAGERRGFDYARALLERLPEPA
ncbi:MAG TPA: TetR/AcrR family transcriptional regulator [Solirubrobacterales bacterium]|nr:TetR/AcrR family transcriptional regulator [Solirubrobacterales bacterium]